MAGKQNVKENDVRVDDDKGGALSTLAGNELAPADFAGELGGLTDLGYSTKAEDTLVPILSILQDNSGEVKKNHSRRLDGAESGHLIIRSIQKLIDPKDPVLFQPCAFGHNWVAWRGEPGDGVVTGNYPFDDMPKEAEKVVEKRDDGSDAEVWKMPDGSRLVDTRYHYGYLFLADGTQMQIAIPMAGTNHAASRGLTQLMSMQRLPGGARAPGWFCVYRLDTKYNERGTQSWYNYSISWHGWVLDRAQRDAGRLLNEMSQANEIQADVAAETAGNSGDAAADDDKDIPI